MHLRFAPALALTICLSASTATVAQIKRVPAQYTTISAALLAGKPGDTILVAAGTYKEYLQWPSVDGIHLRSEEGPAKTIIDAGRVTRVVSFFPTVGVTRKTIIEGFTFTKGKSTLGGGMRIHSVSPTIRFNRFTDNLCESPSSSGGGGILVSGTGSNPLIAFNEIDHNVLQNSGTQAGAGVFMGDKADIIGNYIHDNRSVSTTAGVHAGYGAGVYISNAEVLLASNLIVDNTNNSGYSNLGGGVAIFGKKQVAIFNNTIVGNSCMGTVSSAGGILIESGLYVRVIGNIVAQNTAGGIHNLSPTYAPTLDHNNVWKNGGSDYHRSSKGKNSISADPKFVSATDRHLASTSPCIDAIPATHLPATVAMDVDRDPRRIDGDLDGGRTNGARLDIGADEFTGVRLGVTGTPKLGNQIAIQVTAAAKSTYVLAADLATGTVFVPPWGNLLIGFPTLLFPGGSTPASIPVGIPMTTGLIGLHVHLQALVIPTPSTGQGQFTNLATISPY